MTNKNKTIDFPIISDQERFGKTFEEERPVDESGLDNLLCSDSDPDYQPLPIHQNPLWPPNRGKKTQQVSKSHGTDPSHIKIERPMNASTSKKEEIKEARKPIPSRPFRPSEIISPIFGKDFHNKHPLSKPTENEKTLDFIQERLEQSKELKESPTIERVEKEITIHQQPILLEHLSLIETDEEKEKTQLNEEVLPEEGTQEKSLESFDEEKGSEADLLLEKEVSLSTVDEQIEAEQEQSKQLVAIADDVIQLEQVNEQQEEVEVEEVEENVTTDSIIETTEKEKIVPFNVLMLASDKKKLAAKQELAPVQQQDELPVVEESTEELVQIEPSILSQPEKPYELPPLSYLDEPIHFERDEVWIHEKTMALEEALFNFSIQAKVQQAVQGPSVTRFEVTVEKGTKVSKIRNLSDDLKLALAAKDIRIEAPIPGTSFIGIEIPNDSPRPVQISEIVLQPAFQESASPLEAVLGLDITGEAATIDLRKMPHGLIAGATGSGKSVAINCLLTSILYKATPDEVNLLLIDPKMVELAPYNGIPHLISPVITDVKAATLALKWAVNEMEERYTLFAKSKVRNIEKYNEEVEKYQTGKKLPYLLIVIDELADLMMMAPQDVEVSISRIAQKARAAGIHLLIATQRPSVDVITGIIKANVPTRIAFAVSSQVDSRTIVDQGGAEKLLGRGDMLYLGNGESSPVRLQGAYISDEEMEKVIAHVSQERQPKYLFGEEDLLKIELEHEQDPLFIEACEFIVEQQGASTSSIQRKFNIGYNRAARIIDQMEDMKLISEQNGSKPRDVFITLEQLADL